MAHFFSKTAPVPAKAQVLNGYAVFFAGNDHHIFCLSAASDDAAAQNHIQHLDGRDKGIDKQDLNGKLLYSRLHLIDRNIGGAEQNNDRRQYRSTHSTVQNQFFGRLIGRLVFPAAQLLPDDNARRLRQSAKRPGSPGGIRNRRKTPCVS